jgi:hypothetical protein
MATPATDALSGPLRASQIPNGQRSAGLRVPEFILRDPEGNFGTKSAQSSSTTARTSSEIVDRSFRAGVPN